jgi:hypothetical protein
LDTEERAAVALHPGNVALIVRTSLSHDDCVSG